MHRPLRYLFWFIRLPTSTPAIPWLIKKEKKIPPCLSHDPTLDGAPSPRWPTTFIPPGCGNAPPSSAVVALLPRRRRRCSSLAGGAPSHGGLPSPAKLCELGLDAARCAGTAGPGCIAWGLGRRAAGTFLS